MYILMEHLPVTIDTRIGGAEGQKVKLWEEIDIWEVLPQCICCYHFDHNPLFSY